MKSKIEVAQQHMFSNKMIASILIPVILEQLLNSVMGTADTMMVNNIGSAAISAVSLVDSINIPCDTGIFSALAAGGRLSVRSISDNRIKKWQMNLQGRCCSLLQRFPLLVSLYCLGFKKPLLRLIFGSIS